MKLLLVIIFAVLLLVGGFLLLDNNSSDRDEVQGSSQTESKEKFDQAPDFTLTDFDGNEVSLSQSTGKIRVVNSWATWCPFCVEELPDFARLQEEFPDIVVIAIGRSESKEKALPFTDEIAVTGKLLFLLDPKDSYYQSIGGFSMPETLFIDGEGNIRIHKRGPMEFEEMKEKVLTLVSNEI